jgi:hypothetical protein
LKRSWKYLSNGISHAQNVLKFQSKNEKEQFVGGLAIAD